MPDQVQNRASLPGVVSRIQKLRPSLQTPDGPVAGPVPTEPSGLRSAAFHNETLSPPYGASPSDCRTRFCK